MLAGLVKNNTRASQAGFLNPEQRENERSEDNVQANANANQPETLSLAEPKVNV